MTEERLSSSASGIPSGPCPAPARGDSGNCKHIVIVGGVAGGASAAARARRLCEGCKITVFERGPHVSFASCGLAYHVGDVIEDESSLLVATPKTFEERFAIDVRTRQEVTSIDKDKRLVGIRNLDTGEEYEESYDELVLSPGARPIVPPIMGSTSKGVYSLRNIEDVRRLRDAVDTALQGGKRATVIGGGFIGLELAENLEHRGMAVTLLERAPQVMGGLDPEMAILLTQRMEQHGIVVRTSTSATAIIAAEGASPLLVETDQGQAVPADLVVFAIGVRPESDLAKAAGLELGPRGGIKVDDYLRTSDPHIWAVGDAIEVEDSVTHEQSHIPLAGPANRQGRVVADNMLKEEPQPFGTVRATSVIGLYGLTAARTGATEASLQRTGTPYQVLFTHPGSHAGYYPGARTLTFKLLYSPADGTVLGAQAVGEESAERRIDVVATSMQFGATVHHLAQAELCYAPQFGSAKDPVNQIGMLAENVLEETAPLLDWNELKTFQDSGGTLIDVRSLKELATGSLPGARHIPVEGLRDQAYSLATAPVAVLCESGQRAHVAVRMLRQLKIDARLLSGGMKTARLLAAIGRQELDIPAQDLPALRDASA